MHCDTFLRYEMALFIDEHYAYIVYQASNSWEKYGLHNMSRDVRKPVFGVSDQVRHKPGCAATEDD